MSGQTVSNFTTLMRVVLFQARGDDPLLISKSKCILLDTLSKTFNHSCSPNAGLRNGSELFALQPIAKGEEITYDYSTNVVSIPGLFTSRWRMDCSCKSVDCRGVIGSIETLPEHILDFYVQEGALQDYVKDELRKRTRVRA